MSKSEKEHLPKGEKAAVENRQIGEFGESVACDYLKKQGYEIVARNFRFGRNEIDIIASNARYIVFAEVKTRSRSENFRPSGAVTLKKRRGIVAAARGWLGGGEYDRYPRFDVIEVVLGEGGSSVAEINHIEGAFDAAGRIVP